MVKRFNLVLLLFISWIGCLGQQVDVATARMAGAAFLGESSSASARTRGGLQLAYTFASDKGNVSRTSSPEAFFYVFNESDGTGFVIVSGKENLTPIIAYSRESTFNPNDIPDNLEGWMEGYRQEALWATEKQIPATEEIRTAWTSLTRGTWTGPTFHQTAAVSPLVQTRWNQSPHFNALCPFDTPSNSKTVAGCVATAMAQLMKFWNYPPQGTGFHSYNHQTYGTLSANFGNTTYQWTSMPNVVSSANPAVATLLYHCGVSVNMNYGPASSGGSGAYTSAVVTALKTYFSYPSTVQEKYRSGYTETQWKDLIKSELNAGRPIEYSGSGSGGGHSFVCDGFDNNEFFHFNWGWGGNSDGYYSVNALNPTALGDGGGTGGFNSGQAIIIGVQPPAGVAAQYDMRLFTAININPNPIPFQGGFSVTVNLKNFGTTAANNFAGDYCAAVFNSSDEFISYVQIKTGNSLAFGQNHANPLVFTTAGIQAMTPGNYKIGIYYKPTGATQWSAFADGAFQNFVPASVPGSTTNPIRLSAAIATSPSVIVQNQPLSATFNVSNSGSTAFTGAISIDIHKSDGTWIRELAKQTNLTLNAGATFAGGLNYSLPTGLSEQPGTYQLFAWCLPAGGEWTTVGSGTFSNPISVLITEPPPTPDAYETNNTVAQAYTLPIVFTGNTATKTTTGSNCHSGTDYDYFKILLPGGYNYSVNARLHDKNNSGNGINYTLNALFSMSTNGTTWAGPFDDVPTGAFDAGNGGNLFFLVAPFFTSEKGTYLLDITITRSVCSLNSPIASQSSSIAPDAFTAIWSPVAGSTGYQLDVSTDNFTTFLPDYAAKVITGSTTNSQVTGLSPGTAYKYRVRATGSCVSASSNPIDVTTPFKQPQTISFTAPADNTLGNAPFNLTATSSSSLAVSFSTTSTNVTLSGSTVTMVKAGRTSISALQGGNAAYQPATDVSRSFCIKPAKPTITITDGNTVSPTLTSSAATGNAWFMNDTAITGATANTLKVTAPGIYKVRATVDDCVSEFSTNVPMIVTGDISGTVAVTAYPNPADNFIEVTGLAGDETSLPLFDANGRVSQLALERTESVHRADVRHLSSGLYLLLIQNGSTVRQVKFMKR